MLVRENGCQSEMDKHLEIHDGSDTGASWRNRCMRYGL